MSWSRVDVYEFIRMHDERNYRYDEEIDVLIDVLGTNKNCYNGLNENREVNIIRVKADKFAECGERNEFHGYIDFCKERRSDIDAIEAIREALIIIHEALEDIEINRICKGIREVVEGIRHTKEGVKELTGILNKIFE